MSLYTDLAKRLIKVNGPEAMRRNMMPMKLTIATTFLCNHKCTMCDIWTIYRKDKKKLKQELTKDDFVNLFTEMKDDLLYLDWGGGEPFLRPDMPELIGEAGRICNKLSSVVITTNGLMPERIKEYMDRMATENPHLLFALGISIDGDEDTHDEIRGKKGAFAAAERTLGVIRELQKKHDNIEVKLSYTISYANSGTFETFDKEVLSQLGLQVGDVGFGLEHVGGLFQTETKPGTSVGRVSEDEFRDRARKDVEYIIAQLDQEDLPALQRMKAVYRKFFLQEIPNFLENPRKMVIPCTAARSSLYIDPYGYIYPCIVWSKQLGHVRDGIANVLAKDLTGTTRKQIDEGKCPVCWNACEAIPSLLSSMRMVSCVARSFTDAKAIRSVLGGKKKVA